MATRLKKVTPRIATSGQVLPASELESGREVHFALSGRGGRLVVVADADGGEGYRVMLDDYEHQFSVRFTFAELDAIGRGLACVSEGGQ